MLIQIDRSTLMKVKAEEDISSAASSEPRPTNPDRILSEAEALLGVFNKNL